MSERIKGLGLWNALFTKGRGSSGRKEFVLRERKVRGRYDVVREKGVSGLEKRDPKSSGENRYVKGGRVSLSKFLSERHEQGEGKID